MGVSYHFECCQCRRGFRTLDKTQRICPRCTESWENAHDPQSGVFRKTDVTYRAHRIGIGVSFVAGGLVAVFIYWLLLKVLS